MPLSCVNYLTVTTTCYIVVCMSIILDAMANGTVRLKGRELVERFGKSMYRVHKDGKLPYSTVHRIVTDNEGVEGVNGETLYGFLIGLGLTPDEAEKLPLGDVFSLVPTGSAE